MKKTDFESKYLGNCPVCANRFPPRQASLLGKKLGIAQVYILCSTCKSSVVVFILKNTMGFVTTIGMLTDLTKDDIVRFGKMKPITSDEVLELHRILEDD